MTDEDEKLILEWCGFKFGAKGCFTDGYWKYPDDDNLKIAPPTLDLTFYFKYAVARLWLCDMEMLEGIFFVWTMGHPDYGDFKSEALENPAEAFGQALLKLIRK